MANQRYDYKRLVDIYLATKIDDMHPESECDGDNDKYDEALQAYYRQLLAALEKLFNIRFTEFSSDLSSMPSRLFQRHFIHTVESYCQIRSPGSSYLDASLLYSRLEQQGEAGQQAITIGDQIYTLSRENSRLHRELLYHLLVCIYGPIEQVVTSEELREVGFDDTTKPVLSQY